MKILIAGLGSIGRRHLKNLLDLDERDILLYRSMKSTLPDGDLADLPVETNLQKALAQQPYAVIVSNPTALHLDVAIPAVKAGCHLFLEKPISHNLDRVDELRSAVAKNGVQVLVGYQFRFHPGLLKIKQLLDEGAISKPISVHAHWGEYLPGWHPWEDYRIGYSARSELGGGVILTLSHPLDYLRWFFGKVASVWAFTDNLSDLELSVEDTAEIGLRFTSGVTGSVHLDYNQRPPSHYLEIIGAEGTIRWDNNDGAVRIFQTRVNVWETIPAPIGFERNHLFLAEMRHFLDVVRGKAEALCSLEDGIKTMHLAIAAQASHNLAKVINL